jgi:CRP/FNR family transcriptional regulator, cyclic AMP receptor protein
MAGPEFVTIARSSPFFAHLDVAVLEQLAAASRRRQVERGAMLFFEGDSPDSLYLVESGAVRIFTSELDGTETTIRIARESELFGELAVIDQGVRAASALTIKRTVLLVVPAAALIALLPAAGSVESSLLRGLVDVVRANTRRLIAERTQRLEDAVARVIADDPEVLRSVSQGELAGLLGVSRQSLNKTLKTWERDGLLERTANGPRITNIDVLRQRALGLQPENGDAVAL